MLLSSPFFVPFIGTMAYLALLFFSALLSMLMTLFERTRLLGKWIFLTALISFPILVITGLCLSPFMILLGLVSWILKYCDLEILIGFMFLGYFIMIAFIALYHWYLGGMMILNHLTNEPIDYGIENDRVYRVLFKKLINRFYLKGKN